MPAAEHAQLSNDSAEVQQKVVVTAKPKLLQAKLLQAKQASLLRLREKKVRERKSY